MMERRVKCILDSGAYSAWGQGIEIDLRDYIRYVQEHKHLLKSTSIWTAYRQKRRWKRAKLPRGNPTKTSRL